MPNPGMLRMLPVSGSRQATENRLLRPSAAMPLLRPERAREEKLPLLQLLGSAGRPQIVQSFAARSAMRRMRQRRAHTSSSRVKATRTLGRISVELPRRRHRDLCGIA